MSAKPLTIEVAAGELIDKITILEIKVERISDSGKRGNVRIEYEALKSVRDAAIEESPAISRHSAELKAVNEELWNLEDRIRACEKARSFGSDFVQLARAIYVTNDRRARIKRAINDYLGSRFKEEKSYEEYE
jgi:hypothetical protein